MKGPHPGRLGYLCKKRMIEIRAYEPADKKSCDKSAPAKYPRMHPKKKKTSTSTWIAK